MANIEEKEIQVGTATKEDTKTQMTISPIGGNIMTNHTVGIMQKQQRDAYHAENKDYFDMLDDVDARQQFFSKLTTIDENDHNELNKVKSKINSLIQHEIKEMGFAA